MVIREQRYKSTCVILKNTPTGKTIVRAVHTGTWYRLIESVNTYAKIEFDNRFNGMFPTRGRGSRRQSQILAAKSRIFFNALKSVMPLLRQDAKIYEGEKRVQYEIAKKIVENYTMRGITLLFRSKIAKYHDDGPDLWQ